MAPKVRHNLKRLGSALSRTDKDWELIAQQDPYFGVLTHEQFLQANWTEATEQRFWVSGDRHIAAVFAKIEKHLQPAFQPKSALDFGCGVGRLLLPLADRCESVTGIDVSATMLSIAAEKLAENELLHVSLSANLDALDESGFDFIHTFIVFQHISVARGYQLLDQLLQKLNPGGIGAVHVTFNNYSRNAWLRKVSSWPLARQIGNILKKQPINQPAMQMNEYDMGKVLTSLHKHGCERIFFDFTDHGVLGAILYFEKQKVRTKR